MASDYDERGRQYRTTLFDINPDTGADNKHNLTTDTWRDTRGHVIKIASPGGLVEKSANDGAGRLVRVSFTDGGGDPAPGAAGNWAAADGVVGDTVNEEFQYAYDRNGNVVLTTRAERWPNATGTGELGDHDTQPYARVSYTGSYYDRADRPIASVDVGTNGNSPWTDPVTGPADWPDRADTVLVTTFGYNAAGYVFTVTDLRAIEARHYQDGLGRPTRTIEGYVNGVPSGNDDRITDLEYGGSDHVVAKALWLDDEEYERTAYLYGVDVGQSNVIASNDLLSAVWYLDVDSGDPEPIHVTYAYNGLGEVVIRNDILGTGHAYTFDAVGRPTADAVVDYDNSAISDAVLRLITDQLRRLGSRRVPVPRPGHGRAQHADRGGPAANRVRNRRHQRQRRRVQRLRPLRPSGQHAVGNHCGVGHHGEPGVQGDRRRCPGALRRLQTNAAVRASKMRGGTGAKGKSL